MATSGFKTWQARLASGRVTHAQAVQFCHAIYSRAYGEMPRGKATNVTQEEAEMLVATFERGAGLVVDEMATERGRRWLAANERRLCLPDLAWGEITRFMFECAVDGAETRYGTVRGPLYRAEWPDGSSFIYGPTAWQAGGNAACDMYWRHLPVPAAVRP